MTQHVIIIVCPTCKLVMGKAGKIWSGKRKVQRWRCSGCGRTTTKREVK